MHSTYCHLSFVEQHLLNVLTLKTYKSVKVVECVLRWVTFFTICLLEDSSDEKPVHPSDKGQTAYSYDDFLQFSNGELGTWHA